MGEQEDALVLAGGGRVGGRPGHQAPPEDAAQLAGQGPAGLPAELAEFANGEAAPAGGDQAEEVDLDRVPVELLEQLVLGHHLDVVGRPRGGQEPGLALP